MLHAVRYFRISVAMACTREIRAQTADRLCCKACIVNGEVLINEYHMVQLNIRLFLKKSGRSNPGFAAQASDDDTQEF